MVGWAVRESKVRERSVGDFPCGVRCEVLPLILMNEETFELSQPLRTAIGHVTEAMHAQGHRMTASIDSAVAAHATCEHCGTVVRVGYSVENPRSDPVVLNGPTNQACPSPKPQY